MARALLAERRAGVDGEPSALEQQAGGVRAVAPDHRHVPQVEPREVGGRGPVPARRRQTLGQHLGDQVAVGAHLRQDRVEPRVALAVRGLVRDRRDVADAVPHDLGQPLEVPGGRSGHRDRGLEPGQVERLGRRVQRDRVGHHRGGGHEWLVAEGQRCVDLVGDHAHAVPRGQVGHGPQLVGRVQRAGGVVGVAQQVRARVAERVLERVEVQAAGGRERGGHDAVAGVLEERAERRVHGRVDDHGVAR